MRTGTRHTFRSTADHRCCMHHHPRTAGRCLRRDPGYYHPGTEVTTGTVPNVTSVPATPVPTALLALENTTGVTPNVTPIPTTPVPLVFISLENATGAVNPPPLLIFDPPVIQNLTTTIYGIVYPGSTNVTIVSLLWDWGDGQAPEYHGFPNSHAYSSPGHLHLLDHRPAVRRTESHRRPQRFPWGIRSSLLRLPFP